MLAIAQVDPVEQVSWGVVDEGDRVFLCNSAAYVYLSWIAADLASNAYHLRVASII